jgi:hypothetical protein
MIRQYSAQYFREQTYFVLQALYEWDPGEDPEEQDNESILVSKIKQYINLRYPPILTFTFLSARYLGNVILVLKKPYDVSLFIEVQLNIQYRYRYWLKL